LSGQARLSMALGRWNDALRHVSAALSRDPLDPNSLQALTVVQWGRGHLADAEAAMRRAMAIRPTYAWGHYYLGRVLLASGDGEAALAEMKQETAEDGQQLGLAMTYYALGRKPESDAALAQMRKEQADENAFGIAEVYAFRGQSDEAMYWLERAYSQKDPYLIYLKIELPQKSLAPDPRFKAFLKKMNLPE
jgi:predicted Zn-dependent protease